MRIITEKMQANTIDVYGIWVYVIGCLVNKECLIFIIIIINFIMMIRWRMWNVHIVSFILRLNSHQYSSTRLRFWQSLLLS